MTSSIGRRRAARSSLFTLLGARGVSVYKWAPGRLARVLVLPTLLLLHGKSHELCLACGSSLIFRLTAWWRILTSFSSTAGPEC